MGEFGCDVDYDMWTGMGKILEWDADEMKIHAEVIHGASAKAHL
ncbi:MAG: hypothetical protein WCB14_21040 [Candidatus Acidiferrales bacterium]